MDLNDREGFERFLREEQGYEQKVIPWMVRWVRGFLSGLDSPAQWDQRCREFYAELENRVAGWQYAQAAKSVQLYLEFYHRSNSNVPAVRAKSWEEVEETARKEIRRQGKSLQTEKTYVYWITRFRHYKTTPQPDGCFTQHVKDSLTFLAAEKRVSVATQNQAFNALLFLYRFVLGRSIADLKAIPRSPPSKRLPVVLSADQISVIPASCLALLEDQLATSRVVFIKDRGADRPGVALPGALERKYPDAGKEIVWFWVFPAPRESIDPRTGIVRRHYMYSSSLQKAFKRACREVGVGGGAHLHSLQHSFATHLIESGRRDAMVVPPANISILMKRVECPFKGNSLESKN